MNTVPSNEEAKGTVPEGHEIYAFRPTPLEGLKYLEWLYSYERLEGVLKAKAPWNPPVAKRQSKKMKARKKGK